MTKELDLSGQTIPQLVREAAARFGERIAIEDGDTRYTFVDLDTACARAARAFIAAGVEAGDRVGIWAPNIHEWIVAAVGLQSAGGVLVPLNTRMKGAEAGYILRKSGARILCTVGEFLGARYVDMLRGEDLPALEKTILLRGSHAAGIGWLDFLELGEEVSEQDAARRFAALRADDLSDILFTSGTTGKPKGVMTCHGQNLRAFEVWSRLVGLREGDRYLIVNPFFHSFGYKAGWVAAIMRGATILPQQVFDVPAVLDRIGKERINVIPGAPTLYQSLLAHPEREKYDLSSLRLAVTGAAVVPVELVRRMRDELSFETVLTAYGLTEVCGLATMCRVGDSAETIATTSGRAIPGVEVRCVDSEREEVSRGEAGEVVVRGYNVMRGYFDDLEATAETIDADGWLHTGDVGVMDEAGNLRITDRIKDMFIMGGFNCYPAEIESLMFAHEDVAQVAVIGVPDERMGEVAMAFVVPTPGRQPTPESIIAWCREHMANYKVPRRVEVVEELPMNAMGKVTKFVLRGGGTR
jgi:acyl-CoA synthetase (AMP-forming)/AMP-acid ligase II